MSSDRTPCPQGYTDYEACFSPFRYCPVKGCGRAEGGQQLPTAQQPEVQTEWEWTLEDDVVAALNSLPSDACVGDQAIAAVEVFTKFLEQEAAAQNNETLAALAKRLQL